MYRVEYNNIGREMRNWLGAGDCWSWDDAALGVCCTRCQLMIMAWRDREWWLNFVYLGDGRVEEMGKIIMRNWDLREFRMRVSWLCPIRQVRVPIWRVITPIRGLLNPIRQLLLLLYHIHSYPLYGSPIHSPSLSFPSTTLPSSQGHQDKSSVSISLYHHLQLTPSAAYTERSICRVQHTPSTAYTYDCLLSLYSHDFELTPEFSFILRHTSPQIDRHQAVLHMSFKAKVTSSHSHGFKLRNRWIESKHGTHLPSTASRSTTSKYSSNVPRL